MGVVLGSVLLACANDDRPAQEEIPPGLGCFGVGVRVSMVPAGVDPDALAADISAGVPDVMCMRNRITGAVHCLPGGDDCGVTSSEAAMPARDAIAAFLAADADADADGGADGYTVSIACACYSD